MGTDNDGMGVPAPDVLVVEIRRTGDGKIIIRSPHLSLDGIEKELLGALKIVGRQLDAQMVVNLLAKAQSRIVTPRFQG